ncbi:PH domain-containing protein [Clostridium senegalense]|uniref:PH domain-containing protein n=1 Tax=Clostridium senegalense TaxID=1465809 RepID=UPI000287FC09|nr:PH domain-containing protein [Clostridium senegalense]
MSNLEKPNRNHWVVILSQLLKIIYESIVFVAIVFVKLKWYYGVIITALMIIYSIIKWRRTVFYIKDNILVLKTGVITLSKQEIPLSKITTVDTQQNIINRILNVSTLKVDSGAVGEGKSELRVTIKTNLANKYKDALLENKVESIKIKDNYDNIIKATKKDIFIYGLTKNKLGWVFGLYVFLSQFLDFISEKIINSVGDSAHEIFLGVQGTISGKSIIVTIILILFSTILIYIIVALIATLLEIIRYNDFKLYKNNKKVNIEYGFFTKKKYSLSHNKIQGLKLKQNFIQQFTGLYTIEGIIVGYGDMEDKIAMIFPIANKNQKDRIIKNIFDDLEFEGDFKKPKKREIRRFIVKRLLITIIITSTICYFIPKIDYKVKIGVVVILALWQIILGCLNYKNTSIGLDENVIVMSSGSRTKITHLIKQKSVQSITKSETLFQRYSGVCDLNVDICTNNFGEVVTVRHLDGKLMITLEENLII